MYRNKQIQKLCTDYAGAKKELNVIVADKLFSLINFIDSADNLNDIAVIPAYNLHPLKGKEEGKFAIDLGRKQGFRLIIVPLDNENNRWKNTYINIIYSSTTKIIIWEVSKHYE